MKKKNKLLLNLVEGEKHKHRVAMVNEEAEWNQHEPNSGMARMFFVMLLIHVVVIGGIIVYDWLNGEEAAPTSLVVNNTTTPSALPPPAVHVADTAAQIPIEECATYEWKTGDSLDSVATKLGVTKEVLIQMNMLDKGTQLETNSIIRYPRKPAVRAVGVGVAGVDGALPVATPATSISAAEAPMPLVAPGEKTFSFSPTIENDLAPVPGSETNSMVKPNVQESPPAGTSSAAMGESMAKVAAPAAAEDSSPATPAAPKKQTPQVQEAPPAKPEPKPIAKQSEKAEDDVPKAIPVKPRYTPPAAEKAPTKKSSVPAAVKLKSHTVRSGETLYAIAIRHGVTVKSLQAANKIAKPEALREGMKLIIPGK